MTRSRLTFLFMLVMMLFFAFSPGQLTGEFGTGENRHAFAFAVLPLVSAFAWPRFRLRWQFLIYAALGGSIELVQMLLRTTHVAEWDDWFTDIGAAAIALLVAWGLRRWDRGG
ncbi:hypothetical protein [Sphingomonas sp.]|uniref:hypothetical protein n=1 Tax=Sphingomonas sp. TaxID=28214 RepID=UPI001B2E7611|nr:hypothetical protein [Sphingomonas sp.]MBO9711503.1 hypothetical protein [Sphingomonas sp.]